APDLQLDWLLQSQPRDPVTVVDSTQEPDEEVLDSAQLPVQRLSLYQCILDPTRVPVPLWTSAQRMQEVQKRSRDTHVMHRPVPPRDNPFLGYSQQPLVAPPHPRQSGVRHHTTTITISHHCLLHLSKQMNRRQDMSCNTPFDMYASAGETESEHHVVRQEVSVPPSPPPPPHPPRQVPVQPQVLPVFPYSAAANRFIRCTPPPPHLIGFRLPSCQCHLSLYQFILDPTHAPVALSASAQRMQEVQRRSRDTHVMHRPVPPRDNLFLDYSQQPLVDPPHPRQDGVRHHHNHHHQPPLPPTPQQTTEYSRSEEVPTPGPSAMIPPPAPPM
ncbi:hypothetical protein L9F63_008407, partial [Diploptera punctata]